MTNGKLLCSLLRQPVGRVRAGVCRERRELHVALPDFERCCESHICFELSFARKLQSKF